MFLLKVYMPYQMHTFVNGPYLLPFTVKIQSEAIKTIKKKKNSYFRLFKIALRTVFYTLFNAYAHSHLKYFLTGRKEI